MDTLDSRYNPRSLEGALFASWLEGGYFRQQPAAGDPVTKDAPAPYVITIPPPNVTGSLHMGHALNNTIQDVLIRKNRMAGRPTRWVVGTDHAGIATQNKVEQKLAAEGKTRFDVGREGFIEQCWEWRAQYGSRIIDQLKAMGCSCDYDDEWFTMNDSYQRAVREVFVDWFNAGIIYRGTRIINWCPRCGTALSDIEVEHEEKPGKLYHIRYPLCEPRENEAGVSERPENSPVDCFQQRLGEAPGSVHHLTIATTRPETMLGDVAVAVNPDDERYRHLVGATLVLPLVGREIPIIADSYVDPAFGTGAVKITPAHDPNDFEVGQRHDLEQINIFTAEATVNENGGVYEGLDRYAARERIIDDLAAAGVLDHVEDHQHAVGVCYRCATEIEPWLSEQWFAGMKPLAAPAIDAVRDGRVTFHPKRWENVYFHWMENIRDWCISRQLWWGHRIPVFYCDCCGEVVASKVDLDVCPKCGNTGMRQDEDVLDTWFSSQLWPFATLGWNSADDVSSAPNADSSRSRTLVRHASTADVMHETYAVKENCELAYNYPTSALSTARDILFLWVARMIMSGLYFRDAIPFSDVIIHPTVFNAQGKRMSKSLGTGVDPLDLMEDYGADGMRFGLMLQVTGAQDLKFAEDKLLSSRNFANKIWNAARFTLMHTEDFSACVSPRVKAGVATSPQPSQLADRWILSRLARLSARVSALIDSFELGEAARELYDFFWSEYCDWYIELAKGRLQGDAQDRAAVQHILVYTLDKALRLLHPFMPFVTEEIWRKLPLDRSNEPDALIVAAWPEPDTLTQYRDADAERRIELLKAVVTALRTTRARYGLSPKEPLAASVKVTQTADVTLLNELTDQISALAYASSLSIAQDVEKPAHSTVTVAAGLEIFIPLEGLVDFEAEAARLRNHRDKTATDLAKLEKKLSNEGFLAKAAADIIEKDQTHATELRDALATIDAQLAELD